MLLYYGIILAAIIGLSENILFGDNNMNLHRDTNFEQNACDAPVCRELAHDIQHNMNKSMDPCIDFYEYGCSNWEKDKPSVQISLNTMQYKTYRRVHELLVEENEYDKIPFIKIAKQFYRSCINIDAIENEGLKPIKLLFNATGGWPILMSNEEWYQRNYTWQNIDNFYYRLYGISSFFNIQYKRGGRNQIAHVSLKEQLLSYPFEETLENDTYRNMYVNFMINIVRAFAVDEGVLIPQAKLSADVKAILNFHINLKKIIKNIKYRNQRPRQKETEMMIVELQEFYDLAGTQNSSAKINWLDIIQSTFKALNVNIDAAQLVLVPNPKFLHKLAYLLDTTPSHVIVNYIQWNIVTQFAQYLNRQITVIENLYYSKHTVIWYTERWLTCVKSFPMNDIASYIFVKRYISADIIKAVSDMINKIKSELKSRISSVHWIHHKMKQTMIDKIHNISLQIGYPKWYDNRAKRFNLYKKLKIGNNYFENWLAFKKFVTERSLLNINIGIKMRKSTNNYPIDINSLYDKRRNMMVIPAALIQDPYFTSNTPLAVNYGAIGSIIAYEFVRNIFLDKIRMSFESDKSHIITETEEIKKFRERSICLFNQYKNYTSGMRNEHLESDESKREILNDIVIEFTAIQVAFAAFQGMKIKAGSHHGIKLTTLTNVTDEQLFFLSLINVMCTSPITHYVKDNDHIKYLGYNPKKFRINVILANMAYFSDAFKCPMNSLLNSTSKCIFRE